jgi:hypothetical protein
MSSLFVQVTVVPTGTVSIWGPKTKLSIFTAAAGAEGCAFAVMREDATNSIIAISIGAAMVKARNVFFVLIMFLSKSRYALFTARSFAADWILS